MNPPSPAGRSFFWQGLLILLPVLVLALAGIFSLRQDRILARHEAVEKAQALADQIAGILWERLFRPDALKEFDHHAFRVDDEGYLLFPPPVAPVPEPVQLNPSQLTERQQRLWTTLAATPPPERTRALADAREFLALSPAPKFAGPVAFRLAQLLDEKAEHEAAGKQFELVATSYPEAVSESGVALPSLASLRALQIAAARPPFERSSATTQAALQTLCSNLVTRPPFLAAHLLARLPAVQSALGLTNVVEPWLEAWRQQEALRQLAEAALAQAPAARAASSARAMSTGLNPEMSSPPSALPVLFWFHAPDQSSSPQPVFRPAKRINIQASGQEKNLLAAASLSVQLTGSVSQSTSSPASSSQPEGDRLWLAAALNHPGGGHWIVCRALGLWAPNDSMIGAPPLDDLKEGLPRIPAWLDYTVQLAGVTLTTRDEMQRVSTPLTPLPEFLAAATRSENGTEYLKVQLQLVRPQMFYARQRARTYLFGGLIGLAALAVMVGFFSTRRAFLRQHQLGELKSNFVSSVTHELRAPIASMRLLAESLDRGKISDPARQADYFRFLVQECRRLSGLIENVLNYARIERGQKHYEFEPTDVVGLLQQTMKLMEPAASEKQVHLTLDLDGDPSAGLKAPPLLDGPSIQQALVNLIDNALKHSPPEGTVTVGLRAETLHSSAGVNGAQTVPGGVPCLAFFVQDHGPGIPPEDHERIFEQFYRRGSELRRETQGIGIGLSIVKHIAQAHAGRVLVESKIGQGSRFTLQLPLKPEIENRPPEIENRKSKKSKIENPTDNVQPGT